ncbi:MAG: hypothetical protein IKG85_11045 [Clostridia bacterium]|nr:hypothetical protein [Clostridia bacterium]
MKDSEMFDAIAHIDEDLVDRCLAGENTHSAERGAYSRRRTAFSIAAAAASLVLIVGLIAVLHIGGESHAKHNGSVSEAPDTSEDAADDPNATVVPDLTEAPDLSEAPDSTDIPDNTEAPDPDALRFALLPDWGEGQDNGDWVYYSSVSKSRFNEYVELRMSEGFRQLACSDSPDSLLLVRDGVCIDVVYAPLSSSCNVMVTIDKAVSGLDRENVIAQIRSAEYPRWNRDGFRGEPVLLFDITPEGIYDKTGLGFYRAVFESPAEGTQRRYEQGDFIVGESGAWNFMYYDLIAADIDGDGNNEVITLSLGPTSGLFSIVLEVYGSDNGKLTREAVSAFTLKYGKISLSAHDGKVYYVCSLQYLVPGKKEADFMEPVEFELSIENGRVMINDPEDLLALYYFNVDL